MDKEDYHAFIEEKEVLIQDGLEYEILDIKKEKDYWLVRLLYKNWSKL